MTTDDTTAPVTADPATVTASFDDVAQVAQHLKTYGEGEVWHSACRLLDALRAASERAPVTAEGLRERLTEVATNWMRMYPFANYGFFSCADGDSLGQVHTIADSIAAAWGRDIADRMLAALAGDPGDLPARMAEAIEARVKASVLPERPPYDGSVGLAHFVGASFADLAAAALSVRDEHLVHLTARAEHAEAELSSRIEQHQRVVTRAIAAEGERDGERRRAEVAEAAWNRADRYARRYRLAWQSARDRAKAYGDSMTSLSAAWGGAVAERDALKEALAGSRREEIEQIQAEREAMPEDERIRREAADAPLLRIQLAHADGVRIERDALKAAIDRIRRAVVATYGEDYAGEDVAAEVERLLAHLSEYEAEVEHAQGNLSDTRQEVDELTTENRQLRDERDALRETLAESDLGALTLAQWEAIAAGDADRDRLEGQLALATGEHAHQYRMATRFLAERDAFKAAIERFRQRHIPHDCERDHTFAKTPIPCVNADLCRCGSTLPCRELAALDAPETPGDAERED